MADCRVDIGHSQEAFEPVMSMLKTYINEDLVDHIETVVQTGEDSELLIGFSLIANNTP
jgi:hypothetical protein